MDPNEALKALRALVAEALNVRDEDTEIDSGDALDLLYQIADQFEGLDHWLSIGGFAPDSWRTKA